MLLLPGVLWRSKVLKDVFCGTPGWFAFFGGVWRRFAEVLAVDVAWVVCGRHLLGSHLRCVSLLFEGGIEPLFLGSAAFFCLVHQFLLTYPTAPLDRTPKSCCLPPRKLDKGKTKGWKELLYICCLCFGLSSSPFNLHFQKKPTLWRPCMFRTRWPQQSENRTTSNLCGGTKIAENRLPGWIAQSPTPGLPWCPQQVRPGPAPSNSVRARRSTISMINSYSFGQGVTSYPIMP